MRRYIYVWMMVLLVLSGCVSGTAHIKVNPNGSADMNIRFGAEQQAKRYLGNFNPFVFGQSVLKQNGFRVKEFDSSKEFGFEASRHYESIEKFKQGEAEAASGAGQDQILDFSYQTRRQLFFTVYDVKSTVNFSGLYEDALKTAGQQLGTSAVAAQFAASQLQKHLDLKLKVSLPVKAEKSNADKKEKGGKTLVWNIDPVAKNNLAMTLKVPNIRNIAIAGGAALVLLLILLILWVRSRRKWKQRREVTPVENVKEE